MKIVHGYPPNYSQILEVLPGAGRRDVVFTHGDTIFVPEGVGKLPHALVVHEQTHMRQQGNAPEAWWARYLADPAFRLAQEIECYHAQYIALSRVERERCIREIAGWLSGPIYGNLIGFEAAKRAVRTGAVPDAVNAVGEGGVAYAAA